MNNEWRRRDRLPVPQLRGWSKYAAAQRGRRIRRRAERERALLDMLPPGVSVERVGATHLLLTGYGHTILYDPTHNNAQLPGEQRHRAMLPREVAQSFIWRWKREGCPKVDTEETRPEGTGDRHEST